MDLDEIKTINLHLQTGRPRGSDIFLDTIEREIGRPVRPQERGRKPKQEMKPQEENKGGFFSAFPLRARRSS